MLLKIDEDRRLVEARNRSWWKEEYENGTDANIISGCSWQNLRKVLLFIIKKRKIRGGKNEQSKQQKPSISSKIEMVIEGEE